LIGGWHIFLANLFNIGISLKIERIVI